MSHVSLPKDDTYGFPGLNVSTAMRFELIKWHMKLLLSKVSLGLPCRSTIKSQQSTYNVKLKTEFVFHAKLSMGWKFCID